MIMQGAVAVEERTKEKRRKRSGRKKVEWKFVFAFNVSSLLFFSASEQRQKETGGSRRRRKYLTKDLYSVSLIKFS